MTGERQSDELWMAEASPVAAARSDTFLIDIDGFEGPLDLLLVLARNQKVDLARISVLQLAEQYVEFVHRMRELRLEIAADYLVMAAWLVFLKSKLLLPEEDASDEPTGDELAAALAFRLRRLEAMRAAARRLMSRHRLTRELFARGDPEPIETRRLARWQVSYYDLLTAYAQHKQRTMVTSLSVAKRSVWSLKDAQDMLFRLVGSMAEWAPLEELVAGFVDAPETRKTALASSFSAALELAREGQIELRQSAAFTPLYLRRASQAVAPDD